jgi:hypothetical protein
MRHVVEIFVVALEIILDLLMVVKQASSFRL